MEEWRRRIGERGLCPFDFSLPTWVYYSFELVAVASYCFAFLQHALYICWSNNTDLTIDASKNFIERKGKKVNYEKSEIEKYKLLFFLVAKKYAKHAHVLPCSKCSKWPLQTTQSQRQC